MSDITDNSWKFEITQVTLTEDDFKFTPPSGKKQVVYDGQEKTATVTSNNKDIVKDTDITVKYYYKNGTPVADDQAINKGGYEVRITVKESPNYTCADEIKNDEGEWVFEITPKKVAADSNDIEVVLKDHIYDGNDPTITVKDKTLNKELVKGTDYTVQYQDQGKDDSMADVGHKVIKVIFAENYSGEKEAECEVTYLTDPNATCTITGGYDAGDGTIWIKSGDKVIITPADGYTISDKLNGEYKDTLEISVDTDPLNIYLQNSNGQKTGAINTGKKVKVDQTSPTGTISINDEAKTSWQTLLNKIFFGLLFADERQVTITATDAESGVDLDPTSESIQYYIAESNLINDESGISESDKAKKLEDEITKSGRDWENYTNTFKLSTKDKRYVVYAKITDNVGNITYVSSQGIVIYLEAEVTNPNIEFIKAFAEDKTVELTLHKNDITNIYLASNLLAKDTDYTVSGPDENGKTTVKFNSTYLGKIAAGNHELKIYFHNSLADADTDVDRYMIINLNVKEKAELDSSKFTFTPPADTDLVYDGQAKTATVVANDGVTGIGTITVKYFKDGDASNDVAPKDAGTYKVKISVEGGTNYSDISGLTGDNWTFTIEKAKKANIETPSAKSDVKYGTKLSEVALEDGWHWVDGGTVPSVGKADYAVYYDMPYDSNYDYSAVEGYNQANNRVERSVSVEIVVDKSGWGKPAESEYDNVENYVSDDGTVSAEVKENGLVWIKNESNESTDKPIWYAIDNSNGIFEKGSRFEIRRLEEKSSKDDWEKYKALFDDKHLKEVNQDKLEIFLVGVTGPDGKEYTKLNSDLSLYVKLGSDWDEDDIVAVFLGEGNNEEVNLEYIESMSCPGGIDRFAKLTLKHFSPYAIYEKTAGNSSSTNKPNTNTSNNTNQNNQQNTNTSNNANSDVQSSANSSNVNSSEKQTNDAKEDESAWDYVATGDQTAYSFILGTAIVAIISCSSMVLLRRKRKKM